MPALAPPLSPLSKAGEVEGDGEGTDDSDGVGVSVMVFNVVPVNVVLSVLAGLAGPVGTPEAA